MGQRSRTKKYKVLFFVAAFLLIVGLSWWYISSHTVAVLQPAGQTGIKEKHLIIIAGILSVIVVVPVYAMTIGIALRYRESNKKPKKYSPDWDGQPAVEFTWWAIPIVIIGILSVITWKSSHELDPYKALAASRQPITVQVVSLDWKWLFIYPEQNIASVNFAEVPAQTPVDFEVTSDSVMNSFWVPQLGGQIYAMPGMDTHLNLLADRSGSFAGSSANISGRGFASMDFTIKAGSQSEFTNWVKQAKASSGKLTSPAYGSLAAPSSNNPVSYYSSVKGGLFDSIVNKYMPPGGSASAHGAGL